MEELKCPHCNAFLEVSDCTDLEHDGNYVVAFMSGYCPECKTEFTWKEEFTFKGYFDLEE